MRIHIWNLICHNETLMTFSFFCFLIFKKTNFNFNFVSVKEEKSVRPNSLIRESNPKSSWGLKFNLVPVDLTPIRLVLAIWWWRFSISRSDGLIIWTLFYISVPSWWIAQSQIWTSMFGFIYLTIGVFHTLLVAWVSFHLTKWS